MISRPMVYVLLLPILLGGCASGDRAVGPSAMGSREAPIIIDHACTDLDQIPEEWILKARETMGVAYGLNDLGVRLLQGLEHLELLDPLYEIDRAGRGDALAIFTKDLRGDLGTPDRYRWVDRTRFLLEEGWGDVNVVMWCWGDQLTRYTPEEVDLYLEQMEALEAAFPGVAMVYTTAPLDGKGSAGNTHLRNEQIRAYCRSQHKILFDVADIERFDPDGNDYLDREGDFGGYYQESGSTRNWAGEWCDANPKDCSPYDCRRSKPLICDMNARAFWWMMARLAGWEPLEAPGR